MVQVVIINIVFSFWIKIVDTIYFKLSFRKDRSRTNKMVQPFDSSLGILISESCKVNSKETQVEDFFIWLYRFVVQNVTSLDKIIMFKPFPL